MSQLPKGWSNAKISDVTLPFASIDPTKAPTKKFSYVDIGAIDNTTFSISNPKTFLGSEAPTRARRVIKTGDTLFSTVRTYLKNIAIVPQDLDGELTSTGIAILRPNSAIDSRYLFLWSCSNKFVDDLSQAQDGTMYPAVSDKDVSSAAITLPPLPEQKRIVAKIDNLSDKSKRARAQLNRVPRLVEKYRQAVLTLLYRDAQRLALSEPLLGDISAEVRNGLSKKPDADSSGIAILRISSVRQRNVQLSDIRFLSATNVPPKAFLQNGDLLFTRYNGNADYVAVCGQVRNLRDQITYPDKLIRVRLRDDADPTFIEFLCSSPQARAWLLPHIKSAAGQHGISGGDLKELPVPLPELEIQKRLVRRSESALKWIDTLAAEATSARKLIDNLDQAILAKAFCGDLLPQDPSDEPAEKLLKRIAAERAVAPKAKRGRSRKE